MEARIDYNGEDLSEITAHAIRLYAKELADGDLEKYKEIKASLTVRAQGEECVPWDYIERATASMVATRAELDGKRKRVRGMLLVAVGITLVLLSGLAYVVLAHHAVGLPPMTAHAAANIPGSPWIAHFSTRA